MAENKHHIASKHARKRIRQRPQISKEDINFYLEIATRLPALPGIGKIYSLFYNPFKKKFFIAVRDEFSGTVITILHLYHYESKHGKIDHLVKGKCKIASATMLKQRIKSGTMPFPGMLRACLIVNIDGENKKITLFKCSDFQYADLKHIVKAKLIIKSVHEKCDELKIPRHLVTKLEIGFKEFGEVYPLKTTNYYAEKRQERCVNFLFNEMASCLFK